MQHASVTLIIFLVQNVCKMPSLRLLLLAKK